MLAASACWRWAAPEMLRSSAICVVSNSTGGNVSWREEGGGPSVDLTRLHPWCALPSSARRAGDLRDSSAVAEQARRRGGAAGCAVAAHGGAAPLHRADLAQRERARGGDGGGDLRLQLGEALEVGTGGSRRGAERLRGAQALRGGLDDLVPAAVAGQLVLALGERHELGPGGGGAHATSAQASRSSPRSPETWSIFSASCSTHASIRWRRQNA